MTMLFAVAATSVIHVLVLATIFLGLGVLLLLLGVHSYREGRLVANTPETPIGSIPVGLVRIRGKATGAEILTSPVTGVPCYYYHLEVDKWVKKDDQERWQNFKNETAQRNFLLDDGTARVLIDPQDAEFDLPQSLRAEIGPESSQSCYVDSSLGVPNVTQNQLYACLMSDWQKTRAAVQSSEIPGAKAADKFLAVGQKMASLGFSMDVDGVSINPSEAGESFRFSETCLLADREYSVMGTCEQNSTSGNMPAENIIRKGKNKKAFLITGKTGNEIGNRLRWQAVVMILVGIAMIIGTIAVSLIRARR